MWLSQFAYWDILRRSPVPTRTPEGAICLAGSPDSSSVGISKIFKCDRREILTPDVDFSKRVCSASPSYTRTIRSFIVPPPWVAQGPSDFQSDEQQLPTPQRNIHFNYFNDHLFYSPYRIQTYKPQFVKPIFSFQNRDMWPFILLCLGWDSNPGPPH